MPGSGRKITLFDASVYKVQDDQVIESWMFHYDTAALLELLTKARQQAS